jgi:hypothetical protein
LLYSGLKPGDTLLVDGDETPKRTRLTTMKIHVINSMTGMIRVHAAGCKDVTKDVRRSNSNWTEEVPVGESVEDYMVRSLNASFGWTPETANGEPQPWHGSDIEILPCARKEAK